jgi:hypothetical protein
MLAGQLLYNLSHAPSLFFFFVVFLLNRVLLLCLVGMDLHPPIYTPCSWDDRHMLPHPGFNWLIWVFENSLPFQADST